MLSNVHLLESDCRNKTLIKQSTSLLGVGYFHLGFRVFMEIHWRHKFFFHVGCDKSLIPQGNLSTLQVGWRPLGSLPLLWIWCQIPQPRPALSHLLGTKCKKCTQHLTEQKTEEAGRLPLFIPECDIADSNRSISSGASDSLGHQQMPGK